MKNIVLISRQLFVTVTRSRGRHILVSFASSPPPSLVISGSGTLLLLLLLFLLLLLLLGLKKISTVETELGHRSDRSYSFILRILTLVLRSSILVLTVLLGTIFVIELLHVIFFLE